MKLTPEGWVYLVVLGFITVGAVLRNVNLLIFMAGMMYAPLLINWRLGLRRLRALAAYRRVPSQIHANETTNIQWTCENKMRGVAAWNVVIDDRVERLADADQTPEDFVEDQKRDSWFTRWFGEILARIRKKPFNRFRSDAKLGIMRIGACQSEVDSYRVFFGSRGKYVIGPAAISTTFPFGLIISRIFIPKAESVFVAPQIGNLSPTWEKRVQSTATGSEAIKRQRALEEDEFYALRPWRSGDSKKNIHWRTTAKYGEPIVKQHDQPNNRDFALVLDLFSDQSDLTDQRCEKVLSFAATVILKLGTAVQGQVAIGVCGGNTEICHSRSRKSISDEVMNRLAVAKQTADPETLDAILAVANHVSTGTPIYVVSSRKIPNGLGSIGSLPMDKNAENLTDPRALDREAARLERLLSQVEPLVRWIDVDSEKFKQMFQMEPNPAMVAQLEELKSKWATNA